MTTTPDPQAVREIADAAMRYALRQNRVVAVEHAILALGAPDPITTCTFTAYSNAALVEYDRRAAALPGPDEQPQDERNPCGAQLPADSAQRLGASPDTRCARPDGHTAHDDGNGVLWIDRERAAQDERDGDARAVADFLASDKLGPAMAALHDHFAARIAELAEFAEEER